MDEMQVDVEEVGLAGGAAHEVPLPDLLREGVRHRSSMGGRGREELFGGEAVRAKKSEYRVRVRAVPRVHDDVETDPAEQGGRTQAVDTDVEDVDVLAREEPRELVQHPRLVLEPRAEREVASRGRRAGERVPWPAAPPRAPPRGGRRSSARR